MPSPAPGAELGTTPAGEFVLPPPATTDGGPLAFQQAIGLETVQRGIHGALGEVEAPAAPSAQSLERRVTVHGSLGHHGQQERVQVSLDVLAGHV
jgi:hypothetical protein